MAMVTGYQWGDTGGYIGPYQFLVIDPKKVHLPPRTTLKVPPEGLPEGQEAAFDPELDEWVVRPKDMSWAPTPVVAGPTELELS
ncbi:hypothetical protein [Rhodoferax sp. BLA1]|uniref:hypothetical protein n=1 Tax=Rhodoferax sp. BLA1 TaxID=2576062 RepID=UPI0015D4120F|nr:hypothetical protein [Rhodoferax sp. BLA1]